MTRSKSNINSTESIDDFFKTLPSEELKKKMKDVIKQYLDENKVVGNTISDVADKKALHSKIACLLKKLNVDRWADMEYYHLNGHQYKMFKSLVDATNYELTKKLTP